MENEQMYPYTAKEARERGELEQWRANYRANCACAGAIELVIRESFDGMHLKEDCAKRVIDHYGYKRTAFVLATPCRSIPTMAAITRQICNGAGASISLPMVTIATHLWWEAIPRCWMASLHSIGRSWQSCTCLEQSTVHQIPVNRTSPERYWCCRRKCCEKPAGGRRISFGWRGTASAAAPTPEAVRYAVPVLGTVK